ncbi:hypothetical protein EAVNVH72_03483 [Elizabethkingia anophelis]|uniref:bacteriophage abortive infection AbiH family protein n=1 Tax=Elizabethkingia anophelis TaxID=1117645 RepID=UPI0020B7D0AB|nr:bacteriophage abortive infection AbiH family protein [Elizabethkingia anophelis]UTG65253.1 bacteriophage abortive infection AbiH family protein [Elizabethkingia anophelis]CAH1152278.1 hypothetical protein EAVNVH72_02349 [Elizabethkingia anophelis]CAI9686768.1 hypothetical protein EAVNVH72_03483 [Elizabethkingia anophelis]
MKTLYIIGNGFDIHHRLDTRYQSFANYLAENDSEVYDLLLNYYGLPDITNPELTDEEYALWSRFEQALADLDYIAVLEDNSDYMANPGAEDFRDRDWHSYQIEMELIIKDLTTTLISDFNNFILEVQYGSIPDDTLIVLEDDSHFLNFNYTETLQESYNIPENRITYIHNRADANNCTLILGHGTDPANFEEKEEEPPQGLSEEEFYEWRERKADEYDYSYESAKQEILSYYTKAFKNTLSIVESNIGFFSNLAEVEKVIVLGHSISEVDLKYFEVLKDKLNESVIWYVSYYSELEKQAHLETLQKLGINNNNIIQIKITDLKKQP